MSRNLLSALLLAGWLGIWEAPATGQIVKVDLFQTVKTNKLAVNLAERGTIESAEVVNIVSGLKSPGAIKWVIEEGSRVKRGQLLLELDDTVIQEHLRLQKIATDQARAALFQAAEEAKLLDIRLEGELRAADQAFQLAEMELAQFLRGDVNIRRLDMESRLHRALANHQRAQNQLAKIEAEVRKGTATKAEQLERQLRVESARLAVDKVRAEQKAFDEIVQPRMQRELERKIEQAKFAHESSVRQKKVKQAQGELDRQAKQALFRQEQERTAALEEQLRHCRVVAPIDGIVIYEVRAQARGFGAAQPMPLTAGETVREGQKLFSVVNLQKFLVRVNVPEAAVPYVRPMQKVSIRVDAFPNQEFTGEVQEVSKHASQRDWMMTDTKVYPTVIRITNPVELLKPGMTAEAIIYTGRQLEGVLAVPRKALVRIPTGRTALNQCYVVTRQGTEPRDVRIGLVTDEFVEIKGGLKEGEEILLNPPHPPEERRGFPAGRNRVEDRRGLGR